MSDYVRSGGRVALPRLPREGSLDLTYRCNNDCLHCWVRLPTDAGETAAELSLDELKGIVDQARRMGCREWCISGGEPMLRPDFEEIFDCITGKCAKYTLNTNGTLITPAIAKLMVRNGSKMVALYGATAAVHDGVTRRPGSFEMTMRGMVYLREAGAAFVVQIIPMRANYHEFDAMLKLGESLSPHVRVGAGWLYLSASRDEARNRHILDQRLAPETMLDLEPPDVTAEDRLAGVGPTGCGCGGGADQLFDGCVNVSGKFHVDPYGTMSFCCFVKDPALRYDLRHGSFRECWETFLPAIVPKIKGGQEYAAHCGACERRAFCRWCPALGYLEQGRYSARIEYLCAAAQSAKRHRDDWVKDHRRYYAAAGITVQVDSDLPFAEDSFESRFKLFEKDGPGDDTVTIRHHFSLPQLQGRDLGQVVYDKIPWRIHRKGDAWIYLCGMSSPEAESAYQVAVFSRDYRHARIHHRDDASFRRGGMNSLTYFSTDQILLGQLLADRQGCYLHSSGVSLHGEGLLFTGHSEAGKSTMMKMMKSTAEWLSDDRMIVRRWPDGFRIHGSWSHGEIRQVSPASAPLAAILFLNKAQENRLELVSDRRAIAHRLLACVIKPLMTGDWWNKTMTLVERIVAEVPCYILHFDKSGAVVSVLDRHFA
jgi:MoaA/NifB/PqqE/SkfB family radical SAM enzyme